MPQRRSSNETFAVIRGQRPDGESFEELIGRRIKVDDRTGCWLWTGKVAGAGYGQAVVKGSLVSVHRFVFETLVGPIPPGHHVHHDCETKLCCNPAHLRALSPGEHVRWHAS